MTTSNGRAVRLLRMAAVAAVLAVIGVGVVGVFASACSSSVPPKPSCTSDQRAKCDMQQTSCNATPPCDQNTDQGASCRTACTRQHCDCLVTCGDDLTCG